MSSPPPAWGTGGVLTIGVSPRADVSSTSGSTHVAPPVFPGNNLAMASVLSVTEKPSIDHTQDFNKKAALLMGNVKIVRTIFTIAMENLPTNLCLVMRNVQRGNNYSRVFVMKVSGNKNVQIILYHPSHL